MCLSLTENEVESEFAIPNEWNDYLPIKLGVGMGKFKNELVSTTVNLSLTE